MKKILLIATGGTIASRSTESGLVPGITPSELVSFIPDVEKICKVDTIQLYYLDSTNMGPEQWKGMVECIRDHYSEYDGFVLAHGTDTMAYTAAALSYMIQNSSKPIVITGSQRPINMENTDARVNLLDSFIYASDFKSQGVTLVFDGKVIAGTRAKKVRTKSYNAFSSIDFPVLAIIQDGRVMRYFPPVAYNEDVRFYTEMNESVFLLKLTPGMNPAILPLVFETYDAIIVESFGVGGIPTSIREVFYDLCERYEDKLIVMATQVVHEGSDMTVYEVGRDAKAFCDILESYDMTLEAVVTKVMWLLKNVSPVRGAREEAFYREINHDCVFGRKN